MRESAWAILELYKGGRVVAAWICLKMPESMFYTVVDTALYHGLIHNFFCRPGIRHIQAASTEII